MKYQIYLYLHMHNHVTLADIFCGYVRPVSNFPEPGESGNFIYSTP